MSWYITMDGVDGKPDDNFSGQETDGKAVRGYCQWQRWVAEVSKVKSSLNNIEI